MILRIFLILLFVINSAFSFEEITQNIASKDYMNSQMDKYKKDNLPVILPTALVGRKIINSESNLTRDYPNDLSKTTIRNYITCSFVGDEWTASIYEIKPEFGVVTCMVSKKGDIYNPIGIFDTYYPNLQKQFKLDYKKAEELNKKLINNANTQFEPLKKQLESISDSITQKQNLEFLTIPEILTAAILTDSTIIDFDRTVSSGSLQLKNGFTSKYFDSSSNDFIDNKEYILADSATFYNVYTGLSDISMVYFVLLIGLFGIWGVGTKVLSIYTSKIEDKQNYEKLSPYIGGIVLGILFFFPMATNDISNNNQKLQEYDNMKTKYQEFERDGYAIFTDWANDAAKVIIDSEVEAIINKSGVATKDLIIQNAAGLKQSKDLEKFTSNLWYICREDIFNYNGLFDRDNKHQYSEDPNMAFPTNEKWAYVNSKIKGNTSVVYYSSNGGEVRSANSYHSNVLKKGGSLDDYYPDYTMSACGKNYYQHESYVTRIKEHKKQKDQLSSTGVNSSDKIPMLKSLVKFQYELYRDWGYLSVLGLPVTKMQTEYIGGLYKTNKSEVIDRLNEEVTKDSWGSHMIFSSIPYLFIPGAGTIFQAVSENSGKLGAILGGGSGAVAGGGIFSWLTGAVGTAVGGVAGSIGGGAVGMWIAYETSKTILELTPIIGIVIIGLLRFVIILVKIFSFHFASLFMMPIMFMTENIKAISRFTMRIFSTMLELPIFVLAIWLAITSSSLIHTIGDVFGKKIIIGMLENNNMQYEGIENKWFTLGAANGEWLAKLKIYVFDGFIEISIAIFSIVIIYKIIISLHTALFEVVEIQGSNSLDNAIESMKNESASWGSRM